MFGTLLVVNTILVLSALVLELYLFATRRENRVERFVGIAGMMLVLIGYWQVSLQLTSRMPTEYLRPGFLLLFASIVARGVYEILKKP